VAHGFRKPYILDIKLGTVLYDEDAPLDKKERMEKVARNTTSGETGIRLTGFQVRAGLLGRNRANLQVVALRH
jgi:inositol-polyphosphate multikinase